MTSVTIEFSRDDLRAVVREIRDENVVGAVDALGMLFVESADLDAQTLGHYLCSVADDLAPDDEEDDE
jgi:hypothetical protein